jgi:hypothetical protein
MDLYGKALKIIAWKYSQASKQKARYINYLDIAVEKSKFSVDEN